jgi:light-regulated signal transduction histidine kinase (bacteriophytochrome)
MAALEGAAHIVRYVNPAFCRSIAKKSEELIGIPFAKALPEAKFCLLHLDRVYRTGQPENCAEERVQGRQNTSYAIWPVPGHDHRPIGVMIQAMIEAEAALFRQQVTEELMLSAVRQNEELEKRAKEGEAANKELEAFDYSVSHDLRAPVRSILGFSELLWKGYADKLDATGKKYLDWISSGAAKMNRMIDNLLSLSRISRQDLRREDVDMSAIGVSVLNELRTTHPDRQINIVIKEGIRASADPHLIEVLLSNLLGNAWKFTSKTENARIQFGSFQQVGETVYYVKDNGAGFEQKHVGRLFLPFHRLHTEEEFEGTGIGLAIVERVVRKHGGRIWAEGGIYEGATFFFTLQ